MGLILRIFRKFLFYALLLVMALPLVSSCAGSKNERIIRKIERQSKRNPAPTDLDAIGNNRRESKKVRTAIKKQQKRDKEALKAAEKAQREAIQRHRNIQTPETREQMDRHLSETNQRYKKESFWSRMFRPKTEQEKIDRRREKEARKRLAAQR